MKTTTFITYCSAEKTTTKAAVPALERYLDMRISRVSDAAQSVGVVFKILSGKYGLLAPDETIPWYDHLLRAEEVPDHAKKIAEQLCQAGSEQVVYFTQTTEADPNLLPYTQVIYDACKLAGVKLTVVEINII